MIEGDVEQFGGAGFAHVVGVVVAVLARPQIRRVDVVVFEQLIDVGAVLGRDLRFEIGGGHLRLALVRHLVGDQQIDAVGLAVDVFVDPFEFDFETFGGVADGAEHAETAGL